MPDHSLSPFSAAIVAGLVKIVAGSSVRWTGCEPSTRQRIYFANHTSHLERWSQCPLRSGILLGVA